MTIRLAYDRSVKIGTEHDPNPEILLAKHGHFSEPFFRRVRLALERAPRLVEHIVANKMPTGAGLSERVQTSPDPQIPFNPTAFADADHLYRMLAYWCVVMAQMMGIQAPTPARHSWRATDKTVIGLPANITPEDARYVTSINSTWLRTQLEPIMHLWPEEVMEFHDQLIDVFRLGAKYPMRDNAKWSKLPCPRCEGRLGIYPPEVFGAKVYAVCENCTEQLDEEEYEAHWQRVATKSKASQVFVRKLGINIPGVWRL